MSNPNTFDRQFRRTARGMRRRPTPGGWERVEARLDGRGGAHGPRLFGLRPWMIAAIILLFAGAAALTSLPSRSPNNPLAQRAQSIEDLDVEFRSPSANRIYDYVPLSEGRRDGYLLAPTESHTRLAVSPKYRL